MILDTQPYLVAAILQAFLYALYLVSLVSVLRWLLYEEAWSLRSCDKVHWGQLTTTFAIFVATTVDLAFKIAIWKLTLAGGEAITEKITIASCSIETATLVLTDAILILRCWLIYQRSWRAVCFPLILWVVNIICTVNWIASYSMSVFVNDVPYHQRARFCLQLYSSCNFATNLYATIAIVYQVWRGAKTNRDRRSSILYRVCRVLVTTGILYTCTSLPLVVAAFQLSKNVAEYILCDTLNFSMAGITFNLFLIRVGRVRSELSEAAADRGTRTMSGSVVLTTVQFSYPTLSTNDTPADANMDER